MSALGWGAQVQAQTVDHRIIAGTTDTAPKTVGSTDRVIVEEGGALSVNDTAIRWNDPSTDLRIENAGLIESVEAGGRAINAGGSATEVRTVTITNDATGVIRSENDAIRINTDITGGTVTLNNAGQIMATDGQAIDFDALASTAPGQVTINNLSTGIIQAGNADAIRPGQGAVVTNAGLISSSGVPGQSNDGIDFQAHGGTVINHGSGTINGQRHGVTGDGYVYVFNEAGGTIFGGNGSGVNLDGDGDVTNYGTITGTIDYSGHGDGDGVDVDGYAIVHNYGRIFATGAICCKSPGDITISDGVTTGGGMFHNHAGAQVFSYSNGYAGDASTVINEGEIIAPFGVIFLADSANTFINSGYVAGVISVDMGPGDDALFVRRGSVFDGTVSGNAGYDVLTLEDGVTFVRGVDFERLDVTGAATVTGSSAFQQVAITADGALTLGNGGTDGLVTGAVTNDGVLAFNRSDTVTFAEAITGTGSVRQVGSGTTILSGDNSYTGGTFVDVGTLRLGGSERLADGAAVTVASGAVLDLSDFTETVGGLAGTGDVALGTGTLIVGGGNASSAFGGRVTGTGDLLKTGSGLFALSGQPMTGRIRVAEGEVQFSGTGAGGVRVEGGTLSGAGSFAGLLELSSGTLAPGTAAQPIATLQAASATLSGGSYAVDVGGASTGFASDALLVTGVASVDGATLAPTALGSSTDFYFNQTYVVLRADSLAGTFAGPEAFTQLGDDADLFYRQRYDLVPGGVVLEVRRQIDFATELGADASANQRSVGAGLSGNALAASDEWTGTLTALSALPVAQRQAAFDGIGGEALASVTTLAALAGDRFTNLVRSQLVGTGVPAQAERQGGLWLHGFVADGSIKGRNGQAKVDSSGTGVIGGLDFDAGAVRVGIAGAITDMEAKINARGGRNTGTLYQGGGYVAFDNGATYANLIGSYFGGTIDTVRRISFNEALSGLANGETDISGYTAGATLGRRFELGSGLRFTPQIGGQWTQVSQDGFAETGADTLSLAAARQTRDLYAASATGRLSHIGGTANRVVEPYVTAGVRVNFGDLSSPGTFRFSGAPAEAGAFTVEGARLAKTSALVGYGLDARIGDRFTIGFGAEASLARRQKEGSVSLNARLTL